MELTFIDDLVVLLLTMFGITVVEGILLCYGKWFRLNLVTLMIVVDLLHEGVSQVMSVLG